MSKFRRPLICLSVFSVPAFVYFDDLKIKCDNISKRFITVTPESSLFLWGDNYYGIADPFSDSLSVKYPKSFHKIPGTNTLDNIKHTLFSFYDSNDPLKEFGKFFSSRIKGVSLSQKHAACIDPYGDLFQWGHGFNGLLEYIESAPLPEDITVLSSNANKDKHSLEGSDQVDRTPTRTITGHNLTLLTSTRDKVIAVNDQGKIFFCDGIRTKPWLSSKRLSDNVSQKNEPNWLFNITSNIKSYFQNKKQTEMAESVKVHQMDFLEKGEKIIQLASGEDHVALLTNFGSVYTIAMNTHSNMFGQLGYERAKEKDSIRYNEDLDRLEVFKTPTVGVITKDEMVQHAVQAADTIFKGTTASKPRDIQFVKWRNSLFDLENSQITTLDEPIFWKVDVGSKISQIAAGSHHTLLQTTSGQVWGFGANGYGQLGKFLCISNPNPIIITSPCATPIKKIWAGGATSAFLTELNKDSLSELYVSGAGLWGQLGNNTYRHCQFEMVPISDLSRLTFFNEDSGKLSPIALYSLSMGRTHCAAVLKTRVDNHGKLPHFGYNVLMWGSNHAFQLGTGKRAMSCKPIQPKAFSVVSEAFTKELEDSKEFEQQSNKDRVTLQLFPGIISNNETSELLFPAQQIVCGVDTTAVF